MRMLYLEVVLISKADSIQAPQGLCHFHRDLQPGIDQFLAAAAARAPLSIEILRYSEQPQSSYYDVLPSK